jgi:hypothetical protein
MNLREWMVLYVKHKDLLARKLQSVEEKKDCVVFHFKDHDLVAYAQDRLSLLSAEGRTLIVTLNTKENIDFMIHHFADFSKHSGITVIFANPELNEKWIIVPHTHSRIVDGDIKQGINTMAESVPLV